MSSSKPKKEQYYRLDNNRQQILPNQNLIDWNRGVLYQLPKIASNYLEWVEHPAKNNIQIRMFDSSLLESLSFTPWWVVPALYIPWSFLEFFKSLTDFQSTTDTSKIIHHFMDTTNIYLVISLSLIIYLFGICAWTLFEYFCHRVIFHLKPNKESYVQLCMHFLGHGMHHVTPTDAFRLVFPPAISLPLGFCVRWLFYNILFPSGMSAAFFGGFVCGYACYESIHYLSHHCSEDKHPWVQYMLGGYLRNRNKYHSQHHYCKAKSDMLFGVTSQVWDVVFGTF